MASERRKAAARAARTRSSPRLLEERINHRDGVRHNRHVRERPVCRTMACDRPSDIQSVNGRTVGLPSASNRSYSEARADVTLVEATRLGMIRPREVCWSGGGCRSEGFVRLSRAKTRPRLVHAIHAPPASGSSGMTAVTPAESTARGGSPGARVRSSSRLKAMRSIVLSECAGSFGV